MNIKELGERMKAAREKLDVNPRQFALQAKVDPSQYNKTEAGIKGLGPQKIKDICSTWNINSDWLYTGKGEMFGSGAKKSFDSEMAFNTIISYLKDLQNGQVEIINQGLITRKEVSGVADYLMLKDAEWDPGKLKALKETYYSIVRGEVPAAPPGRKLKGDGKLGRAN